MAPQRRARASPSSVLGGRTHLLDTPGGSGVRRGWLNLGLLVLFYGCRRRLEARMFTVATWNLENLYRPGGVFGPNTDDLYRSKLRQLAATITSIGPDVLAVQEVSQPEALADLVALLAGRWYTTLSAHPDVRGIASGC